MGQKMRQRESRERKSKETQSSCKRQLVFFSGKNTKVHMKEIDIIFFVYKSIAIRSTNDTNKMKMPIEHNIIFFDCLIKYLTLISWGFKSISMTRYKLMAIFILQFRLYQVFCFFFVPFFQCIFFCWKERMNDASYYN